MEEPSSGGSRKLPTGRGGPGSPGRGEGGFGKALGIARAEDAEDQYFAPSRYQEFSREPLVFYKRVGHDPKMLKWTIKVGEAFKRPTKTAIKYFIPVALQG